MKKIKLLNLFPQHIVPDELSLLSVYEILMYLLILFGCWLLYQSWNDIPIIEQELSIERLKLEGATKKGTKAIVEYHLPISSDFEVNSGVPFIKTRFVPFERTRRAPINSYLDSLYVLYDKHYPDSLSNYKGELYYFQLTCQAFSPPKTVELLNEYHGGYFDWAYASTKDGDPSKVQICSYSNASNNEERISIVELNKSTELAKPSFFSLRDISQSYYKIRVKTHTIDTVRLRFHFASAVELSPMGETPNSDLTGNSVDFLLFPSHSNPELITYNSQEIKDDWKVLKNSDESTVLFHVRYKDMDNSQSRRVFLLTAVMSALITVFVAFLIIFVYRVLRIPFDLSKKKESTCERDVVTKE